MSAREIKDGGPAFPTDTAHQSGPSTYHEEGMTLRDYLAAKALTGMLSNINADGATLTSLRPELAAQAYVFADAMLKARAA